MSSSSNTFLTIESKTSKGLTLLIRVVGRSFVIITPLAVTIMAILVFNAKEISVEIKIVLIALFTAIIWLFVWLFFQKNPKSTTTHIVADKKGLHHYCHQNILYSITYADLQPNPESSKYDVFLTEFDESTPFLCVHFFDPALKKTTWKAVNLDIDIVITNGNLLVKNFVKGILIFRPDLKIAPNVLNLYQLKEFNK